MFLAGRGYATSSPAAAKVRKTAENMEEPPVPDVQFGPLKDLLRKE
jgi:hypothetical protein